MANIFLDTSALAKLYHNELGSDYVESLFDAEGQNFIFVSPLYINFKDKPVEHNAHLTGVVVIPGDKGEFIYQIQASAVNTATGQDVRRQLEQIIEPIAGAVSITKYDPVKDTSGHTLSYKVWVEKE